MAETTTTTTGADVVPTFERESHTYRVAGNRVAKLREQIEKLNRRANRVGLPPIVVEELGTEVEVRQHPSEPHIKFHRTFFNLRITGVAPMIEGHRFVATLEHTEHGNVIRKATDFERDLPASFRTCQPECEHCRTNRWRKDTFVLLNVAEDSFRQIGRNCLSYYLGRADVHLLAEIAELWREVSGVCFGGDGDDFEWGGGGTESGFSLLSIVGLAACSCRTRGGYRPASMEDSSTKADVFFTLNPPRPSKWQSKADIEARMLKPEEQDWELAQRAIALVQADCDALEARGAALNDFQSNLLIMSKQSYIAKRDVGLACYLVEYLRRDVEKRVAEKQERAEKSNEHVGTVGERTQWTGLVCVKEIGLPDTGFGPRSIYVFEDAAGNRFKWFTGPQDIEVGDKVSGKATVKGHEVYNDRKETLLTRCKFTVS